MAFGISEIQSIKGTVLSKSRHQPAEARVAAATASCPKSALGETGRSQQLDTATVLSRLRNPSAEARGAAAMALCQNSALGKTGKCSSQPAFVRECCGALTNVCVDCLHEKLAFVGDTQNMDYQCPVGTNHWLLSWGHIQQQITFI